MKKILFTILILSIALIAYSQNNTMTIKASYDPNNEACIAADGSPRCLVYYGSNETYGGSDLTANSGAAQTHIHVTASAAYTVGKHFYIPPDDDVYTITAKNVVAANTLSFTPGLAHDSHIGDFAWEGADPADATVYNIATIPTHSVNLIISAITSAEINLRVMCKNEAATWTQLYPYTRVLALGPVSKRVEIPEGCTAIVIGTGVTTNAATDALRLELDYVLYGNY